MGKQLLFAAALVAATILLSMCLTPETNFFMSSSKTLTPLGTLSHNLTLTPEPTTTPNPAAIQIETPLQ